MSEAAIKRMNLDEFLVWEDGTDTRYELIAGFPLAMAPGMEEHGVLAAQLAARLESALAGRPPCRAIAEAGILDPDRADTFFAVDIGVTCAPRERRRQYMQDPILPVEILSPSTERHDRKVKVPAYQRIASVQEILLVDSDSRYAEIHRRQGEQWIIQIITKPDGTIPLSSVGLEIAISELYEGFDFSDAPDT
jgi:Uma2 family endonuclease